MATVSNFLTEGSQIPAGSAVKSLTSQTVLPDWYTNYAMQLLSNQQAQMATPYTAYQGPRVAEFSPLQQKGFQAVEQAVDAYKPQLTSATSATQDLMGKNALGLAQPYFGQAAGMSGLGAATPSLQQGAGFAVKSADALGMQAAQPYMAQAGQTSVSGIGQYMNPYTQQVVNRIGELAGRNLSENIMPAIESKYITAGQLGYGPRTGFATPAGMMTDTARAIRGVQEAALAEQAKALQAGYTEAAGLSAEDLRRQATLAQTAGQLGTQQQGALAQAGQQLADIGKTYGALTGQQQQLLADIGAQTGAIGGADITRQLSAAQQLAGLGEMAQTLGLRGAGALQEAGRLQQQQAQNNLDVAYQDFMRQQGYNQEQINNALATFKGLGSAVPTATQEYGVVPSGVPAEYKPSTASTIGGVLTGIGGVLSGLKGL